MSKTHILFSRPRFAKAACLLAALMLLILMSARTVRGANFVVPDGDVSALISAINDANDETVNPGQDTIILASDGLYTLTAADNSSAGGNGLPVIESEVIIDGNGSTIQRDAASPDFRIIKIKSSGNLTLDDLTISGGSNVGGGIFNGGTLTLTNSAISGNSDNGIFNQFGTLTITNSTISSNSATGNSSGGGIYNQFGTLTITNSTISSNSVIGDFNAGGGIFNRIGTLTITNSTISGNSATGNPGAGGGIYNLSGILTITNSTISDNSATGNSSMGGGLINDLGIVTISNTILAGNTSVSSPDCGDAITSNGFNIIGDTNDCDFISSIGDKLNTDPLLDVLADNGGLTPTHNLLPGSPAIDMGNPAAPGSGGNTCEAIDQRGVPRPQDNTCDIGAVEWTPVSVFTNLSISQVDSPDPVSLGDNLTFAVTVINDGFADAENVEVNHISPGLSPDTSTLMLSRLGSGEQITFTFDKVPQSVGTATSTAVVSTNTFEFDTSDNSASETTEVLGWPPPDLKITKTDSADPADPGRPLTYTINVINNSTSTATGVVAQETLPSGVSFNSATTTQGAYNDTTNQWNIGELLPGQSEVLSLTVNVSGTATSTLSNLVEVTSTEGDANPADNTATELTAVNPPILCNGLPSTIVGTDGRDFLLGTDGDDVISGLGGSDVIISGDGDDTICGGSGGDGIFGGDGNDIIFGEGDGDTIDGGRDNDIMNGGAGDDSILGKNGRDEAVCGGGNDYFNGGGQVDRSHNSCELTANVP